MSEAGSLIPNLIVPVGTQVVLRLDSVDVPAEGSTKAGAVAEIVAAPVDATLSYRLRFPDGSEMNTKRSQFSILKQVKTGPMGEHAAVSWERFVIYRCVVGSQAYGLHRESFDIDRRGIYLPPADLEWSLHGVPEQIENQQSQECYWELKKFLVLALKANPNILECLFTPIVEQRSDIADALLASRECFLSKLVFQTYNGYVMSQFKKLEQDLRSSGEIKWKHAMHLIRLLLQGISILNLAHVPVAVTEHRDALLAIRDGKESWDTINRWRLALHGEFDHAFRQTGLPEGPDYAEANRLLISARRRMVEVRLDS